jgi:hypothetical protein
MWKIIATTAFLFAACGTGQAGEASDHVGIFGISVGKPITLPRCADVPDATCIVKLGANDFELRFPDAVRRPWVRQAFIITRDDVVKQLLIDTDPAQQEAIVATLNTKYGNPEHLRTLVRQNRYVSIASIEATWRMQGFNVSYTGAESIRAGTLAIKSDDE